MKSVFRVLIMVLTFFYAGTSFGVENMSFGIEKRGFVKTDFVNIKKLCPSIQVDLIYSHDSNFTKKVVYNDCPSDVCYLRYGTAKKLVAVQEELELQGLGLKIADGYRPQSVQYTFWELMPDERYVINPHIAGPGKGSKHNRGAAVDLTLINLATGQELEMPSVIDDFTEKAHRKYEAMEPVAAHNCRLLENVMKKHGFKPFSFEWWHFNDADWREYELCDISFAELAKNESLEQPELIQR
ncbi:M15 family metallopeptidase [bacterium]|nr:MAG: M15 family metallopeptidase [bacterium]